MTGLSGCERIVAARTVAALVGFSVDRGKGAMRLSTFNDAPSFINLSGIATSFVPSTPARLARSMKRAYHTTSLLREGLQHPAL